MKTIYLKNVVWEEGKYFVAKCLNVEVSSFGNNREEALKNLEEALSLYFEDESEEKLQEINRPEIIDTEFHYA